MQDKPAQNDDSNPRMWRADDPRRLRMADKRASILLAARPILLRDGLGGATLDRVAAEGGIAKMTLYRHFSSKEALFESLVEAMCGEMRQSIENAPWADVGKSCQESLANELHAFMSALIAPEALALYRLIVAEGWRLPGVARAFEHSGMHAIRKRVAALLEMGGVPENQTSLVASEIVALALGDAYQRAILGIAEANDGDVFAMQIEGAVAHACSKGLKSAPKPRSAVQGKSPRRQGQ